MQPVVEQGQDRQHVPHLLVVDSCAQPHEENNLQQRRDCTGNSATERTTQGRLDDASTPLYAPIHTEKRACTHSLIQLKASYTGGFSSREQRECSRIARGEPRPQPGRWPHTHIHTTRAVTHINHSHAPPRRVSGVRMKAPQRTARPGRARKRAGGRHLRARAQI